MACPYLHASLAEIQERKFQSDLRSGGFSHENALSLALKLPSNSVCQVTAKAKVNNQGEPVPDQVTFTHNFGKLTLREEVRSSSKVKVAAQYQLAESAEINFEGDMATKKAKVGFVLASALAKCNVTLGNDKVLQASGTLGNEKIGANAEAKVSSAKAHYTLAVYAKRPAFDLMLRCTGSQALEVFYFSYYQRISQYWELFGLVEIDRTAQKRNLDLTCTYSYDQMNSMKAKLVTDGTLCCSVVHSLSAKVGLSYGFQTNLLPLLSARSPDIQYGLKLKLAG